MTMYCTNWCPLFYHYLVLCSIDIPCLQSQSVQTAFPRYSASREWPGTVTLCFHAFPLPAPLATLPWWEKIRHDDNYWETINSCRSLWEYWNPQRSESESVITSKSMHMKSFGNMINMYIDKLNHCREAPSSDCTACTWEARRLDTCSLRTGKTCKSMQNRQIMANHHTCMAVFGCL